MDAAWPKRERGVAHFIRMEDRPEAAYMQAQVDAHDLNYQKLNASITSADKRRGEGKTVNENRYRDLKHRVAQAERYQLLNTRASILAGDTTANSDTPAGD